MICQSVVDVGEVKMIIDIWIFIFLIICSITDLLERQIYFMFVSANGIIITLFHFFLKDIKLQDCLLGVLIGVIALLISIISREAMGIGDGIVLCVIGLALGAIKTLQLLMWSFMIIVLFSIVGIWLKKINLKTKIPLMPFLFLGNVTSLLIGV